MSGKAFGAVMAVLAVVALLAFGVFQRGEAQVDVGDEAPAADLSILAPEGAPGDGETASISDFRGQWVLVNTWASWCVPCEDEAPELVEFQDRYAKGGDFTVLGIQTQDGTDEGLDFVAEYGLNYPSIRDGSGDYADELGATGVPDNILVNPEGRVTYIRRGPVTAEILEQEIAPLISYESGT